MDWFKYCNLFTLIEFNDTLFIIYIYYSAIHTKISKNKFSDKSYYLITDPNIIKKSFKGECLQDVCYFILWFSFSFLTSAYDLN